jgi:riboflavin synthase
MFTGIVQGLCPVERVVDEKNLRRLTIAAGEQAAGIDLGGSVAINGTCLTVTAEEEGGVLCFDVIRETLRLTNLGNLSPGDLVNVERSFRVGDEIGGHILSGHITDSVTVSRVNEAENLREVAFSVSGEWMKYLHHKGFVALDGASLTIASVDQTSDEISVSLIPETIERTTLGRVSAGDRVNLEVDAQTQAVVDAVERMVNTPEIMARLAVHPGTRD